MRCFNHQKFEAIGICKYCGKGICKDCIFSEENGLTCSETCNKRVSVILKRATGSHNLILAMSIFSLLGTFVLIYGLLLRDLFMIGFGILFLVSFILTFLLKNSLKKST